MTIASLAAVWTTFWLVVSVVAYEIHQTVPEDE